MEVIIAVKETPSHDTPIPESIMQVLGIKITVLLDVREVHLQIELALLNLAAALREAILEVLGYLELVGDQIVTVLDLTFALGLRFEQFDFTSIPLMNDRLKCLLILLHLNLFKRLVSRHGQIYQ